MNEDLFGDGAGGFSERFGDPLKGRFLIQFFLDEISALLSNLGIVDDLGWSS